MSLAIASYSDAVAAVRDARNVALAAYILRPGPLEDALVAAAGRGARVAITLQADPYAGDAAGEAELAAANAAAAARLRAAGASVDLLPRATEPYHLKGALCDGVAYLDDRNWAGDGRETIVRDDDADDVAVVRDALAHRLGGDGHLDTRKAHALALERELIRDAGAAPLDVESEAFGWGPIDAALTARARAHQPTRLLVSTRELGEASSPRERARLTALAKLGVQIRAVDTDEKLAVAADRAWLGSANATSDVTTGAQADWGMTTRVPAVVDGVRAAFERNWAAATPFPA